MNSRIHSIKNHRVPKKSPSACATTRFETVFLASALTVLLAASAMLVSFPAIRGDEKQSSEPWTSAQIVQPAALAQELGNKKGTPAFVYVGFRTLFAGGHIPGATLPLSTNLVIYCGCCPFEKCPNIRPAFTALDKMGFKKTRVLILPTSFAADWVEKGYPLQK